ncbi:MAG: hypothetical protein JNL39_20995 [Opitutaceae bacterium]|nr:hypothetical protein [Opitutaceae bacterium]
MFPQTPSLALFTIAAALLAPPACPAHGTFHERMAQLAARIERAPADAAAHFELARLFCQHGDWALALGAADAADALQPGAFATDLVRGEAQLGLGHAASARGALNRFLASQPQHAPALVLRARATTALDGPEAALADYRAATECPALVQADHFREAAGALEAAGRTDDAINVLARGLARLGPDPTLLRDALALEEATGRVDDALARIACLEAAAPRREPWMARRARLLAATRPAESRAAWAKLLRHLDSLPNLERGLPELRAIAAEGRAALESR